MLKKTITYVDYDGTERTEDFYFNMTEAEVTELELSKEGGFVKQIGQIVAAQSGTEMIQVFKDMILKAYGQKSPDGRRFIKSQELRDNFSQTEAYSILFMELARDADMATIFVNGVLPKPKQQDAFPKN